MPPWDEEEVHDRHMKLEWRVEQLERSCSNLRIEHDGVKNKLDQIARTMFQMKWLLIGAMGFAVTQQIGVIESLKLMLQ